MMAEKTAQCVMSLEEIKKPVQHHMKAFDKHFRDALRSKVPLLNKVTAYIVKRKGKQIRPLYVFFSAGLFDGVEERTLRAATMIELMHTASLIHDDVVDDSNERRGFFSLNAIWKNKIAVLGGDYLAATALFLSLKHGDQDLLQVVAEALKQMTEGELLQIEKARMLNIDEDVYTEIIRKKTASLITACLTCGAMSANAPVYAFPLLNELGHHAGLAFQIKDDIMDLESDNGKGKPAGVDIKEKKMTLPLIHLLKQSGRSQKRWIIRTIRARRQDPARVEELIRLIRDSGGLDYARGRMQEHTLQALSVIEQLPDCPARTSLRELIHFTTERKS